MKLSGLIVRVAHRGHRRALTLLELVVVLAVLVALAGAVLGAIPALLRQTSAATAGAGAAQVNAAMQYFRSSQGRYPDGYDSLIQAPYTLLSSLPKGSLRQLKPKDLDNADRPLLAAVGVRTTWRHPVDPGAAGVTFVPVTSTKAFDALAGGYAADDVAALDTDQFDVDAVFGAGTRTGGSNEIFAVFGLGPKCTLVGAGGGMLAAPVTFGGTAKTDPMLTYQRYGLIFRLDRDERQPARFLGAVVFDEDGIKTAVRKASEWYMR